MAQHYFSAANADLLSNLTKIRGDGTASAVTDGGVSSILFSNPTNDTIYRIDGVTAAQNIELVYLRRTVTSNTGAQLGAGKLMPTELTLSSIGYSAGTGIVRSSGGSRSTLGIINNTVDDPTVYHYTRVRVTNNGDGSTTVRVRTWDIGDTEPTGWNIERTDSTASHQVAGLPCFYSDNATNNYAQWVGVGTDGDPAPLEAVEPPGEVDAAATLTGQSVLTGNAVSEVEGEASVALSGQSTFAGDAIATAPPSVPEGFFWVEPGTFTSVTVTWLPVVGATYDIEWRLRGDVGNENLITGISALFYEITGLSMGTRHEVRVRSVDQWGTSAWSGWIFANTAVPAVINLQVIDATAPDVTLSWEVEGGGNPDVGFTYYLTDPVGLIVEQYGLLPRYTATSVTLELDVTPFIGQNVTFYITSVNADLNLFGSPDASIAFTVLSPTAGVVDAAVGLSGSAVLTGDAAAVRDVQATAAATSALVGDAAVEKPLSAALVGQGTLAGDAVIAEADTATGAFVGTATLSGDVTVTRGAVTSVTAAATLQGDAITAAADTSAVSLEAGGTLVGAASSTKATATALDGQSTVEAQASVRVSRGVSLSATASMTANAVIDTASSANVAFQGASSLLADAARVAAGSAALITAVDVQAALAVVRSGASQVGATGTLTADAAVVRTTSGQFSGDSTLTGSTVAAQATDGVADLVGSATLTGDVAKRVSVSVQMQATSAVAGDAARTTLGMTHLRGQSELQVDTDGGTAVVVGWLRVSKVSIIPAFSCYTKILPSMVGTSDLRPAAAGEVNIKPV